MTAVAEAVCVVWCQTSKHCVNGMYVGTCDKNQFVLTAGSDMRIRYWDVHYAANSHIVVNAATDPLHGSPAVAYRYNYQYTSVTLCGGEFCPILSSAIIFASIKFRTVLHFYCWLTQVVLEKRPLNGC